VLTVQLGEDLMNGRERDGDEEVIGLVVIAYEDGHRAVTLAPPCWSIGAGADLERAPLIPVCFFDVRELPEIRGGGPDGQCPSLAFQPDRSKVVVISTSLDRHAHHAAILAAATGRHKLNAQASWKAIGHATGTRPQAGILRAFEICP
jgi:hypothetical protein